jgi:hypothetical protein
MGTLVNILDFAQLLFVVACAPLYFSLAIYLLLARPFLTERESNFPSEFYKSLVGVIFTFSFVSLRDWWVISHVKDYEFSFIGAVTRLAMFICGCCAWYFAWKRGISE